MNVNIPISTSKSALFVGKETKLLNLAGKNLSINNLLYLNAHLLFDITTHNSEINRTILKSALGILGAVLI